MSSAPSSRSSRNKWFAFGALLVAATAFVAITVSGIGENLVYYWGPSELTKAGDKAVGATIRLGGQVKKGSIVQAANGSLLEFDVTDGTNDVHVRSNGVPPQMFREEIGVVVEGTMTKAGIFQSDRLMVSHGNEYRPPKPGEKVDPEKLIKSTSGIGEGDRASK